MPIEIYWGDAKQDILVWKFRGDWTFQDAIQAQKKANKLIASVNHMVDIIADISESPALPLGVLSQYPSYRKELETILLPNQGAVLVVGSSTFIRTIMETYRRIRGDFSDHFGLTDTMEEAYHYLGRSSL